MYPKNMGIEMSTGRIISSAVNSENEKVKKIIDKVKQEISDYLRLSGIENCPPENKIPYLLHNYRVGLVNANALQEIKQIFGTNFNIESDEEKRLRLSKIYGFDQEVYDYLIKYNKMMEIIMQIFEKLASYNFLDRQVIEGVLSQHGNTTLLEALQNMVSDARSRNELLPTIQVIRSCNH
jgi:hypothetical protein